MSEKNIRRTPWAAWALSIVRDGVDTRAEFPDEQYGGKEEALKAAVRHRDLLFTALGEDDPTTRTVTPEARRKHWHQVTVTGVEGIGFSVKRGFPYVIARWRDESPERTSKYAVRGFACMKYGTYGAISRAVDERRSQLERLDQWVPDRTEMIRTALRNIQAEIKRRTEAGDIPIDTFNQLTTYSP